MPALATNKSESLNAKGIQGGVDIDVEDESLMWGLDAMMGEIDTTNHAITKCDQCGTNMRCVKNAWSCFQCGLVGDYVIDDDHNEYSTSAADSYNTNDASSTTLKIVGRFSYSHARSLRSVLSDYTKQQTNTTRKQFMQYNAMAMARSASLPEIVLNDATTLYSEVQRSGRVRRSKGRLGAMAACLGIVCNMHDISKKPKDLAAFMQVDEKYVSNGDKMLRELHANGEIMIEINYNPRDSFLTQYFMQMNMDIKWIPCAAQIIERAVKQDMVGENNSRTSTKCAGVTFLLGKQLGLDFSRDDISKKCKISHSTFVRYYEFIFTNRKLINPILRQWKVPTMHRSKNRANTLSVGANTST